MADDSGSVDAGDDAAAQVPEHDLDVLRSIHEEARAVLDTQIATVEDLDDKAARTSRLDALLLGLLLTAGSFLSEAASLEAAPYVNAVTSAGVLLLVASLVLSIATYTATDLRTGLGPDDVRWLVERRYSERDWLVLLLRSEAAWLETNARETERNATLLTTSHGTLVLGVVCVLLGVGTVHL